jgi:poly(3-hydroxybutyrate) depolymerase
MSPIQTTSPNGNIVVDLYSGGRHGTEVELVSIVNGLHDWPGGFTPDGRERRTGVRAVDLLWDFFKAHPQAR